MLLGSQKSQIGWLVLVLGSFMFWLFVWHADVSAWRFGAGRVERTWGQALGCNDTGFFEGRSESRRGVPIYENHYRYEVAGRPFQGSSFAKGQCVGGPVEVEYLRAQPEVSRIAGMRRRPFGPWMSLIAVIPAVGMVMALVAFAEGRVRLQLPLLRDGLLATGRLIDKTRTNVRVNNRRVYRMTFEYTAQSGVTGRVTTRTNRPAQLEDNVGALLFYAPADPERAVLLAGLPGSIAADETGQPVARASRGFSCCRR